MGVTSELWGDGAAVCADGFTSLHMCVCVHLIALFEYVKFLFNKAG